MAKVALIAPPEKLVDYAQILERRGHTVERYHDPLDASDALTDEPSDLVIVLDRLQNGESGFEVAARVRGQYASQRLPIIIICTDASEAHLLRGYAAGASECLVAPVSSAVLLAKSTVLLSRATRPLPPDATTNEPTPAPPLKRYAIEGVLGEGSYGVVYSALDTKTGVKVALKVMSEEAAGRPECQLRFLREAYALGAARGPNIAELVDFGSVSKRCYYVMEHVEGPTLLEKVYEENTADERETIALLRGLGSALIVLGRANLLHRDIKPRNIVLKHGRFGDPVLVDFGLAKRPFDRGVTSPDVFMGTPGYLPPELVMGLPCDQRSDLYSVGLLARFAFVGTEVFPHLTGMSLVMAMAKRDVPLPQDMPKGLAQVIYRLTRREPDDRTSTATELMRQLDALDASKVGTRASRVSILVRNLTSSTVTDRSSNRPPASMAKTLRRGPIPPHSAPGPSEP